MAVTVESSKVDSLLEIADSLGDGEHRAVSGVSWEDYERLLEEMEIEHPGIRLTYTKGTLEFMAPLARHEACKEMLLRLVTVLALEPDIEFESRGATTYKRRESLLGVEPDTCFYIQNAEKIAGKERIDLRTDPPPDIVVEVDLTSPSKGKSAIYAEFGVPELWVYARGRIKILELVGKTYEQRTASPTFPFLTAEILTAYVKQSETHSQHAALKRFRTWVQTVVASKS